MLWKASTWSAVMGMRARRGVSMAGYMVVVVELK